MKKIILILSAFGCMGATSCQSGKIKPFPDVPVYVVDVGNAVCAEYKIIDQLAMKFDWVKDWPLDKCQDVVGFDKPGFTKVKNWVRDLPYNPPNAAPLSEERTIHELMTE